MKRTVITTAIALAAVVLTGCGQKATNAVAPTYAPARASQPTASGTAGYNQTNAPAATGTFVLKLSSLKATGLSGLEVKLAGTGLSKPLVKPMTAAELANSTTMAFEGVPAGTYSITLSAGSLGAKSTSVTIKANAETPLQLQLKLSANKFDFSVVDPNQAAEPAPTPAPSAEPEADDTAMLGVEILSKESVRKLLVIKKLAVTLKITNHNKTESLSGEVKVDFYKESGILSKETKLVETISQSIKNLAPGKSTTIVVESTKTAADAEATVNTVIGSATASTSDVE